MQRNSRATISQTGLPESKNTFDFSPESGAQSKRAPSNIFKPILLLDLDNTLTDTRAWFADFILASTAELASAFAADTSVVNDQFAEVASTTTLHEYAYIVEAIASKLRIQRTLSFEKIEMISEQFWQRFDQAHRKIELYDGVIETLKRIRVRYESLEIIILTDSPEWVALQRLSLTGLLPLVDGVVAIRTEEPALKHKGYQRCITAARQRVERAMSKIQTEHLALNLAIPASFAKPSSAGIELIINRLGAMPGQVIICGDKDSKEGKAAAQWRMQEAKQGKKDNPIHFVRANYGNHDLHHPRYRELGEHISSLKISAKNGAPELVSNSIERFEHLQSSLSEILERTGSEFAAVHKLGSLVAYRANGLFNGLTDKRSLEQNAIARPVTAMLSTR